MSLVLVGVYHFWNGPTSITSGLLGIAVYVDGVFVCKKRKTKLGKPCTYLLVLMAMFVGKGASQQTQQTKETEGNI